MSMNMSKPEREAYLKDLHVGVISIEQANGAPLSAPIWYDYDPAIGLWILTEPNSKKGKALAAAQRFTLVAQDEAAPLYKYVSVSGPVVEVRVADAEKDTKPMAYRYFDRATADMYLKGSADGTSNYYLMRPEQWLTLDYSKM
ncbi:MAG: general stress protein 26 [Oceanicoccus sp.]|jgi:general stress protein 26